MIKDPDFKLGHEINGFHIVLLPSHVQEKGSAVIFLNREDYEHIAKQQQKQKSKCPTCRSAKHVVAWGPDYNKCTKCNLTWKV